ncbi:GDP-mannose 4,6-dehydratase [Candidatus Woesearchaeota archaeon]|nr:GDP-mannose 4,6-dehydratase [Candidatus Woesearchaeota archaeon]
MRGLKNRSVVVTGGAGFIGSHLVDLLIKHNPEKLIILDNFFLGMMDNLAEAAKNYPQLDIINLDITNLKELKKIIISNSPDVIFNLAIIPLPTSLEKPEWTYGKNVKMTQNLCELMRQGHFKTLVQCSSSEVYGSALQVPMSESHPQRPMTPYAASKLAADSLAISYYEAFGMDITIPRPFNNYGPRQNDKSYAGVIPLTIKRILKNKSPVIYGDGNQTRDFIFVEDTVRAIIDIYVLNNTRGKIINIATGKEISVKKLVSLIMEQMNCKLKIRYQVVRPGDVRRHKADISLAKKLINFKVNTDFHLGLRKTIEYFKGRQLK